MNKSLEKIQNLLAKNEEWKNQNPTTSGNENPFPPKIENAFVKYYNNHYNTVVSYETEEMGRKSFNVSKSDIENSLYHAWFDCTTIEECLNTIEYWIKDYFESYIEDEELTMIHEPEVESIEK